MNEKMITNNEALAEEFENIIRSGKTTRDKVRSLMNMENEENMKFWSVEHWKGVTVLEMASFTAREIMKDESIEKISESAMDRILYTYLMMWAERMMTAYVYDDADYSYQEMAYKMPVIAAIRALLY